MEMRSRKSRAPALSVMVAMGSFLGIGPVFCNAAALSWTNATGGDWGNSANWNPQQTPTSADDALFTLGSTSAYNITLSSDQAANSMTLLNDDVALAPNGNTLALGTISLAYQASGFGTLALGGTGTLSVLHQLNLGTGQFSQTGAYVGTPILNVAGSPTQAVYRLSAGTLGTSSENLGANTTAGSIIQTGGVNQFSTMSLGVAGGNGTYTIQAGNASGGTISLGALNSALSVSGGTLKSTGAIMGSTGASVASSVNLSAGTMEISSLLLAPITNSQFTAFNWTGGTLIMHGALQVGSTSMTGHHSTLLTVPAGSTLAGDGTIENALSVSGGATLSPGTAGAPAIFNINPDINTGTLQSSSNFVVQIAGTTAGSGYSQLKGPASNAVNSGTAFKLGGSLIFNLGYAASVGDQFTIVKNQFPVNQAYFSGTFANLGQNATFNELYNGQSYEFQISYTGGTGDDVVVTTLLAPEPSSILSGAAVVAACLLRRRRYPLRALPPASQPTRSFS